MTPKSKAKLAALLISAALLVLSGMTSKDCAALSSVLHNFSELVLLQSVPGAMPVMP
jgi:hypothetical protein